MKKKLQQAYDGGEWSVYLPNTASARTEMSSWRKSSGVRCTPVPLECGDLLVVFNERLADKRNGE